MTETTSPLAPTSAGAPLPVPSEHTQPQATGAAEAAAAAGDKATPKKAGRPAKSKDAPVAKTDALSAALAKPLPGDPEAPAVHTSDADRASQIFVACKLPHGLNLENGIVLRGSNDDGAARAGGFGITTCDGALFKSWFDKHQDMVAVRRGLIFYGSDAAKVVAQARDYSDLRNGFEQLSSRDLPTGVTEEDDTKAAREREKALGR